MGSSDHEVSGRGALALADASAIQRAMACVVRNEVRSLGLRIKSGEGPVGPRRAEPQRFMTRDGGDAAIGDERFGFSFSDDVLVLGTHGTTHIDALCHVWSEGTMYGGLSADLVSSAGAKRLGIDEAGPVVTRVLMVDGVPDGRRWLDVGEPVSVDLLRRRLNEAELKPASGDALFVRTGWLDAWLAREQDHLGWGGLDTDAIDWIAESGFCMVGADNIAVEKSPAADPGCAVPLHIELLRNRGIFFLELLDLSVLKAPAMAAMLIVSPLKIVGGTASPVAPTIVV